MTFAEPAGRRFAVATLALALIGFALRAWHGWEIGRSPLGDLLMGDSEAYDRWARAILATGWLGKKVYLQAPLYPYLLGAIYSVAGPSLEAVRAAQALLGGASCALLALAGRRWFSARAGLAAGAILALYPPAIFYSGLVQKSALDLFFVSLLLWLTARLAQEGRARDCFWVGLASGAMSLSRENALALLLALAAWVALRGAGPARARWRGVAALAAGTALALGPVLLRNHAVGGQWVITTPASGPSFWIGNGARADGGYVPIRPGREGFAFEWPDALAVAEQAEGRTLTHSEASRYWWKRSLEEIAAAPGRWLLLMGKKTLLVVNRVEQPDTDSLEIHAEHGLALAVLSALFGFGLVFALGAAGVAATWSERRRLEPLLWLAAVFVASVALFHVNGRYRLPLAPMLMLFAGATLVEAARRWSAPGTPRLGAGVAALVAAGISWLPLTPRHQVLAYTNVGGALIRQGRPAAAEGFLHEAIDEDPRQVLPHELLGLALLRQERRPEALMAFEKAASLGPILPGSRADLCALRAEAGRFADARRCNEELLAEVPDSLPARLNLGNAAVLAGRPEESQRWYREALSLDPSNERARLNLAAVLGRLGRVDEARAVGESAPPGREGPRSEPAR